MNREQVLNTLNDALKKDPEAINKLFLYRVPINEEIRDHPTIQVRCSERATDCELGFIGLLNSFLEPNRICMVIEDDKIVSFRKYDL